VAVIGQPERLRTLHRLVMLAQRSGQPDTDEPAGLQPTGVLSA